MLFETVHNRVACVIYMVSEVGFDPMPSYADKKFHFVHVYYLHTLEI